MPDLIQSITDPLNIGGSKAPPAAPDPNQTAAAQSFYNTFNQNTPYGSLNFSAPPTGAGGAPTGYGTMNLNLSPEIRSILDSQLGVSQNTLSNALMRQGQLNNNPLDFSGLPSSAYQVQGADPSQSQDAVFQRARGLLDPVFKEQEAGLRQSLADRGLPSDSEIFGNEFRRFDTSRNQAYENAAFDAVGAGNQYQAQMFGQGLAQNQAQNQARESGINEQLTGRNNQFNELAALLGMQQVAPTQLNQFYSPPAAGNAYAQQVNSNYQGELAQQQGAMGGMFGLGAAALSAFSDSRLKRDVRKVGEVAGLPIYLFRYKGDDREHIGFMADEVRAIKPEAVSEAYGYLMVDYSKALH